MVKPIICYYLAINEKHKYHTFGTVQKFIRKIAERYNIDIPCTQIQLTLVISNSMGPWKKFESTVVRLKRSYEDTGSVVCSTTKGRQLERNFEELKPASHVPILGTILNIFDVFVAV
jgi:hypothetical protein